MSILCGEMILVENDPEDADLFYLALHKYIQMKQVVVLSDELQARSFLVNAGTHRQSPKLILLDLRLPGPDGLSVLEAIRENSWTSRIPVVIVSSSRDAAIIRRAYELGANSYIVKSKDNNQFREALLAISKYWLEINQTPER